MHREARLIHDVSVLRRKHWIFDLDGTLTIAVHDFAAIRKSLEMPEGSDILDYLAGLPAAEAGILRAKLHELELELIEKTGPAKGAVPLVKMLHGRGVKLGVLTRNSREIALKTLDAIGVGRYFRDDWVLGRDEAPPKPAPHGVHHLAALWGAAPQDVLMVGDYLYDLQTGRAAGVATVHVDVTTAFRWLDLADVAVSGLDELMNVLEDHSGNGQAIGRFQA